jgi:hypothetical protein
LIKATTMWPRDAQTTSLAEARYYHTYLIFLRHGRA